MATAQEYDAKATPPPVRRLFAGARRVRTRWPHTRMTRCVHAVPSIWFIGRANSGERWRTLQLHFNLVRAMSLRPFEDAKD